MKHRLALSVLLINLTAVLACSNTKAPDSDAKSTEATTATSALPVGTLAEGEPLTALPVEADDAVWGSGTAEVTIVGFLDFECRFCSQGFETLQQLRKKYEPAQLRIVFKHLPLEFHEHAVPAAAVGQVVELNSGSDAFLKFAEAAFENQHDLSFENLAGWAKAAGVDREIYNRSVSDPSLLERILSDVNVARRLGVEATPTFFINGRVLGGAQPIEVFEAMIDEELEYMAAQTGSWSKRYQARMSSNMSDSLVAAILEQDPHDYRVPVLASPVSGPDDAPVTLIEFSDYQCPFCKRAEKTVERIRTKYKGQIRVVFKHLPLPFHENARPSALLAAAIQLKKGDESFFRATRALFETSPELSRPTLLALGEKFGLSQVESKQAIDGQNEQANELVKADGQLADDVVARGTPHFFINGKRLDGARPYEHFAALIDRELNRTKKLMADGVPPAQVYEVLQKDARSPGAPKKITTAFPVSNRPTRGAEDAKVTVHLFSDFQCPYCRMAEQNLIELERLFPKSIRVVWHDFPLPFHERALPLARAAHFAFTTQGNPGFWKLHDRIFALDQEAPRLSNEALENISPELGLNFKQLKAAMESDVADSEFLADQQIAESLGIRGTPALVIGDYLVTGAKPAEYLQRIVELVLDEQQMNKK